MFDKAERRKPSNQSESWRMVHWHLFHHLSKRYIIIIFTFDVFVTNRFNVYLCMYEMFEYKLLIFMIVFKKKLHKHSHVFTWVPFKLNWLWLNHHNLKFLALPFQTDSQWHYFSLTSRTFWFLIFSFAHNVCIYMVDAVSERFVTVWHKQSITLQLEPKRFPCFEFCFVSLELDFWLACTQSPFTPIHFYSEMLQGDDRYISALNSRCVCKWITKNSSNFQRNGRSMYLPKIV